MKNIIRVIPVKNGVFCRIGGEGPKGILPGKCGVLTKNKTEGINILKELYPEEDYEIIDVNQDDNHRPFKPVNKPVNITKSQITAINPCNGEQSLVSEIPETEKNDPKEDATRNN